MPDWAEVRLSALDTRIRLDAEYYRPQYLKLQSILARHPLTKLGRIALVTDGIHASPVFHPGSGIRYISAKCVKNCFFDLADAEEIAPKLHWANPRTALQMNDVIISTVGTIGFCAVADSDLLPANCDRHVGIVRIRDRQRYDAHYISSFINSKYGHNQTIREATGNVQLNLFIYALARIGVPFFEGHQDIGEQVRTALNLRKKAEGLYRLTQQILEEEFGLAKIDLSLHVGYETRLPQIFQARRWDAEFCKPKYMQVMDAVLQAKRIKVTRFVPVGRLISYRTNGHTPLHHDLSVGEVLFLTAEHVSDFRINFNTDKRILRRHHEKELARTALRNNDILVTIKGKVGNCALVRDCTQPTNINQDIALIRLKNGIHPYFFAAWFNSFVGKQLIEQRSTGGINPFLGLSNLCTIPFPILDPREHTRVGNLIQSMIEQAYVTEREASDLIEQATRQVEKRIEQGP